MPCPELLAVLAEVAAQQAEYDRLEAAHSDTWRPEELLDNLIVAALRVRSAEAAGGLLSIN